MTRLMARCWRPSAHSSDLPPQRPINESLRVIDHYDWAGGREAMLRFGPDTGPVVIAAMPLFEEANRTRTFIVSILRMLAGHGIATALPDLPGAGESLTETEYASVRNWNKA